MKAIIRVGTLAVLLLIGMAAGGARTASAQAPTFLLAWGSQGTGPGQFEAIYSVAVAPNGNVYTADGANGRIQEFTATGEYVTEWGSVGTGTGQFDTPWGVAVDAAGNVYVADAGNNRIQKFTATGTFLTQWGTYGVHAGQLRSPVAVAVDASGNVYVGCSGKSGIQKFTNDGVFVAEWGSAFSGPLGQVRDIALDGAGNVYAANVGDGHTHVDELGPTGVPLARFGDLDYTVPEGAAVNSAGEVYLLCRDLNEVFIFGPDGSLRATLGGWGTQPGQFWTPLGMAVGPTGELYVTDANNHRVQKFSATPATPARSSTWGRVKSLYR